MEAILVLLSKCQGKGLLVTFKIMPGLSPGREHGMHAFPPLIQLSTVYRI